MSTAVLITGHARTFARCYASQRWQVFRKLVDPHFFVSVYDDANAKDMEMLRNDYANVHVERVVQPKLTSSEKLEIARAHAPFAPSVPTSHILGQLWALNRVWEFMHEKTDADFSQYVRIRPDSFFQSFTPPDIGFNRIAVPFWGNYGGINDRFMVASSREAARTYFQTISLVQRLIDIGCPMHPESLIDASCSMVGARVSRTLDAEFITLRAPGDPRKDSHPVYYAGDVFRYAAALRER